MNTEALSYLKKYLYVDAAFAFSSGALCLIATDGLTQLGGLNDTIYLTVLGIGLILYSLDLAIVAAKLAHKTVFTKIFLGGDIAWITGSVILTVAFPYWFSFTGLALINLSVLAVAALAYTKIKALRMLNPPTLQHA